MDSQLFIPKKIKVGYQERSDTYTKRLAYIIYYDNKGKLRKETSWQSWRDKKIEPEEFDNEPQDGFIINKNVERFRWSHFGTDRSYIRLYDPRGIEFEVTPENLIGILMNDDCSKRSLMGKYVYAWSGADLLLLPCSSEEYQKAVSYTDLQSKKVGVKDMVPGCVYKTKKEDDVVYLGRYMWHELRSWRSGSRAGKKKFVFAPLKDEDDYYIKEANKKGEVYVEPKSSLDFIAYKVSGEVVPNFADMIDKLKKNPHLFDIVSYKTSPKVFSPLKEGKVPSLGTLFKIKDDIITEYYVTNDQSSYFQKTPRYKLSPIYIFNFKTKELKYNSNYYSYYSYNDDGRLSLCYDELEKNGFVDLHFKLDSGKLIKVDCLSNVVR